MSVYGLNIFFACGCSRLGAMPLGNLPRVKPGDVRECLHHGRQRVTEVFMTEHAPEWTKRA